MSASGTHRRWRWVCVVGLVLAVVLSGCGRKHDRDSDGGVNIDAGPNIDVGPDIDLGPDINLGPDDEAGSPSPVHVPEPTTSAFDPTEEAFRAVEVGSCLPVYMTGYGNEWSHSEPPAPVSCGSSYGGLFQVTHVGSSSGECGTGTGHTWWSYSGASGETTICLERVWVPRYCVLAESDGNGGISALGTSTAVDCDADSVPQPYDTVLVVSAVYAAPANASTDHCVQSEYDANPYWSLLVNEDSTLVCFTTPG
ncbi:hypothetical protein SAXI111661_21010 [Saccharomonospora xinjiangensis]|uniref:hypothetical protein n=1 Tax=Saccharomonospora xinjiangensis TaxID=75294 RepID=UPI0010C4BD52|nr:hypothetical protein [Saccharomonospora xinjiangensis]QBQ61931.1 hypothetical protein EYD13_17940 [Saccharomonospora xinjiangensis]